MNSQKGYDKHRQLLKKKRHHSADKGLHSQSYGFSSIHVRMWELGHKEGWVPKNWCFRTVVLEKTLESSLDSKEIKAINPKGNQPWIFIGRTDAEAETPILWLPDAKNRLVGKDPWTVVCQAPLSTEFSRQEYWSGLPFPTPEGSFQPKVWTHVSCISRQVLYYCATWEALVSGI